MHTSNLSHSFKFSTNCRSRIQDNIFTAIRSLPIAHPQLSGTPPFEINLMSKMAGGNPSRLKLPFIQIY